MRHIVATILAVGFLFGTCFAAEEAVPKDRKNKESYAFGYQFGESMKSRGLDLDIDSYVSGIRDSLGGKEPALSREEIRTLITDVQQRAQAQAQAEMKKMGAKSLEEGKKFLAENQKKEGVKTLPSGLQYKVLSEGSGKTPSAADTVTVNYKGTLIDGTEFDSSYKRGQPTTFKVGGVIKGWTQALQMMKEGSKWQLFIPPDLGYGDRAAGPIPPNSTLIFEVELISVK